MNRFAHKTGITVYLAYSKLIINVVYQRIFVSWYNSKRIMQILTCGWHLKSQTYRLRIFSHYIDNVWHAKRCIIRYFYISIGSYFITIVYFWDLYLISDHFYSICFVSILYCMICIQYIRLFLMYNFRLYCIFSHLHCIFLDLYLISGHFYSILLHYYCILLDLHLISGHFYYI